VSWSYAWAVQAGVGKEIAQDSCSVREQGEVLVLAISDGAGSAGRSHIGSRVVTTWFADYAFVEQTLEAERSIRQEVAAFHHAHPQEHVPYRAFQSWGEVALEMMREHLATIAEVDGHPLPQYAATLVGAILTPNYALFLQIGDGVAVFRQGDSYQVAIEPETTEFVNVTYFLTDAKAKEHLQVRYVEGPVDEVALLTDGLQPMVLHPTTNEPHEAFFGAVFRTLRQGGEDGASKAWLANMLASDHVTNRTDDDTSIIIARRLE